MFKSEKIDEYITRILCPGNVYAYLVEGKDKSLLIDTGLGIYDLKGYIDSLTNQPYDVILTHGHLDHAGGSGQFENVYLNPKDFELAGLHTEIPIRKGYLEQNGVVVNEKDMIEKKDSYLPLLDEQVFDLGNVKVMALPMPGHTDGSMAILMNRSILFGDACNSLLFMQFEDCITLKEYAKNLQEFKSKYENLYDVIYYSHPHNYGQKEILDEMIDLCQHLVNGSIQGVPFMEGVLVGMPINEEMKRCDGKIANVAYLEKNIR